MVTTKCRVILFVIILLCTSNTCKAVSNIDSNFLLNCFSIPNPTLDIEVETNITEALNEPIGASLFKPTANGMKIDNNVLLDVLRNCFENNPNKITTNEKLQFDLSRIFKERRSELLRILDLFLDHQEILLQDIKTIISSHRSKRDIQPTNIIQDILTNFVLEPLLSNLNTFLNSVKVSLETLVVPNEIISSPIQGVIVQVLNTILQTASGIISNFQSKLNEFFGVINNQFTSNSLAKSKTRDLVFPYNIISDLIQNTLVAPIRTTFNTIIITLNSTIYSFYSPEATNNVVQDILNNVVNGIVLNSVQALNEMYTQVNTILNNLTGAT